MIERLRALWLDGMSATQIANALGSDLSRNAVVGKLYRIGLTGDDKGTGKRLAARAAKSDASERDRKRLEAQARRSDAGAKPKAPLGRQAPIRPPVEDVRDEEPSTPKVVGLTLMQLRNGTCRWPIGEPADDDFHFCGAEGASVGGKVNCEEGRPYCRAHARLAYQPSRRPAAHSRPDRR